VLLTDLRPCLEVVPALFGMASLALVASAAGGVDSDATVLLLLPLFWFGYAGSDRQIAAGLAWFALMLATLVVFVNLRLHGRLDWDHAILVAFVGVSLTFGLRRIARDRQALESRLAEAAITDRLTGLPNVSAWPEIARVTMALMAGTNDRLSIASLDLDGFKALNDSAGHPAGDQALRDTSTRWGAILRRGDMLCRVGGDEFLLLLPGAGVEEATTIVDRLRERTPTPLTCSSGLAEWDRAQTLTELVAAADSALYAAKASGRNRTVVASAATIRAAELRRSAGLAVAGSDEMAVGHKPGSDTHDFEFEFGTLVSKAGVILLTARENHFISLSPSCETVLGWAPEEPLGLTFAELVHPDDLAATLTEAGRVEEAGQRVEGFQTRFRCADGSYKRLRFHAATDGRTWHAVALEVGQSDPTDRGVALDTYNTLSHRRVAGPASKISSATRRA
jgi:diguanylate cyclase (GGDEF)-like protein/PAS domain S-box-containing protein